MSAIQAAPVPYILGAGGAAQQVAGGWRACIRSPSGSVIPHQGRPCFGRPCNPHDTQRECSGTVSASPGVPEAVAPWGGSQGLRPPVMPGPPTRWDGHTLQRTESVHRVMTA